ncbi:serine/threonine-protein kinase EDR1 isoform X2 [Aristolochia californica]|uniref:serine/threonine-protein kinase EDR1 isoform X2 n=1 Tax=Aristolochia californica TaxID=171875 RepID=UPI0035DA90DB
MKHIFKKLHFGSSHDPNRSNEIPSTSSPPPTCASDLRTAASAQAPVSPSSASGPPAPTAPTDYFSSEEEFQVQLAMAISASNSEFRDDPDSDQIRAATLLSLGRRNSGRQREDTAETMSRRYWDYNVLDYDEKVADGFYDIYGISTDSTHQEKMPSLAEIQGNLGDLGFEIVVVNRAIDPALEELLQVAHCISLDCPVTQVSILVQRIADLVTEHMGGPVRDANDVLARWMERSTDLRSSLHTSVLPIGCLNVGLSRHRALLFKVLADRVGLPCKLVKGSHYTGIDDDAVNIIKSDNEREFLVDLMAAPGTLIPADILSMKDVSVNSYNPRLSSLSSWASGDTGINLAKLDPILGDYRGLGGNSAVDNKRIPERKSSTEQAILKPSIPSASNEATPMNIGNNYYTNMDCQVAGYQSHECLPSSSATSQYREGKAVFQNKPTDSKMNSEFPRNRETVAAGTGRPPLPMWKNRAAYNVVPRTKQYDVGGQFGRNGPESSGGRGSSSSPSTSSTSLVIKADGSGNTHFLGNSSPNLISGGNPVMSSQDNKKHESDHEEGDVVQSGGENKLREKNEIVNYRHERRKQVHDRFMDSSGNLKDSGSSPPHSCLNRLEPMLDDVSGLEIPWEDLVIGERIGLGSYGEVYHADWNGTEVAVKKFLDQDFSGDALDEFRSEVRIMRRLRHPNVVLFMGAVTRPPNLSIITEFLPRGSLYRLLHRSNCQIDEKRRIKMALDVAKGMNCLHSSIPTIVHRDLKSPNLLVDKNWNVKVCDFGLSRLKHNTFLSSKSTAGTPEWMAPEVLRNEPSNEKCDVYSFGVILWELATLRMPWSGMNPMQVVGAVGFQNRRLDISKEVDPLVARIIWECWQTDPNLRPSFAQLTTALKPLQQLVISNQPPDTQSPSLPQEISVNSTP